MNGNEAWLRKTAEFLEFKDVVGRSPLSPPRVTLFERVDFDTKAKHNYWTAGYVQSHVTVQSMLVRPEDFDKCKAFGLQDVRAADTAFLVGDDGKTHEPAGLRTYMGVEIESIYFDHFWDGLGGKSLLIPSQHLLLYLGLMQDHSDHADRTTWTDPLDVREVMERTGKQDTHSDRTLGIELDYLRDYLAARKKCLFVLRWAERFVTYGKTDALPWGKRANEPTGHGHIEFEGPTDFDMGYPVLRATLWEWFKVDPAPKPRHYMLDDRGEHLGAAEFTGPDGNPIRYESHKDFMRVISFKRDVLTLFNSPARPRWMAFNESPGQLGLCFPRGNSLWASDSPHGQIQVLLGDLAKLDEEYQRALAPFSEIQRDKPHSEWFNAGFMCIPAKDLPWHERLQQAQSAAHRVLSLLTKRNPITSGVPPIPAGKLLRPSDNDEDAFFRIAKEMRRSLLDEGRISDWFLPQVLPAFTEKDGVGSIGALKGFMRVHSPNELDQVGKPLDALNKFRQVDAHSVEATKALAETGYDTGDYATRFDRLMEAVCGALEMIARVADTVAKKNGLSVGEDAPPRSGSGEA
jgi:hypothetical protein